MNAHRSIAELSLGMTGMFEAELLTQLMLREWKHPLSQVDDFRNHLLELAAEVLNRSVAGERFVDEIAPAHMNLVSALYIAESMMLSNDSALPADEERTRRAWLDSIRRSLPSCFCKPELLSGPP